jgi:CheY-like chemotaxis protein
MAKILIADDSRFQVNMLSTWLRDEGFEVLTAADALQAWTSALRLVPDAIVLDLNMPAGSGIQVLKRLRTSAKTQNIPVVVVSGNEDADVRSVVEQLGAAAFLQKPVTQQDLCGIVVRVLEHSSGS